jgi:hypothetical protein
VLDNYVPVILYSCIFATFIVPLIYRIASSTRFKALCPPTLLAYIPAIVLPVNGLVDMKPFVCSLCDVAVHFGLLLSRLLPWL